MNKRKVYLISFFAYTIENVLLNAKEHRVLKLNLKLSIEFCPIWFPFWEKRNIVPKDVLVLNVIREWVAIIVLNFKRCFDCVDFTHCNFIFGLSCNVSETVEKTKLVPFIIHVLNFLAVNFCLFQFVHLAFAHFIPNIKRIWIIIMLHWNRLILKHATRSWLAWQIIASST